MNLGTRLTKEKKRVNFTQELSPLWASCNLVHPTTFRRHHSGSTRYALENRLPSGILRDTA